MFTPDHNDPSPSRSFWQPRPLSVSDALSAGWRSAFAPGYWLFLGMIVAQWIISVIASAILSLIPFGGLVAALFLAPLNAGLLYALVLTLRGEQLRFESLFSGFSCYWPLVGFAAVEMLITVAAAIPILLLSTLSFVMGRTVLVILVPAGIVMAFVLVYIYARLSFVPLIFLDRPADTPFSETLKDGWRMTEHAIWQLILLHIALFLITCVCAVLLVLPVLFVAIPLALASSAAAYEMLRPQAGSSVDLGVSRPICLYCGYSFAGITGGTCPECGAPRA